MIPRASTRRYWESHAASLAWRINLAAWVARLAPAVFFVASAFAVAVYALRRIDTPLVLAWSALGAALALVAFATWWRARSGFFKTSDARVLLESHLRLDTRLTAAELGLVAWPAEPVALPPVLRWRLRVPAGWLLAASGLIVAAVWTPVPRESVTARPSGSPPALLQTQDMLAALKEMKVADPQAIEQLDDRVGELARRPMDEQYSHSALEAADALRGQTAISAAALSRGLSSAADALRSANQGADMSGPAGLLAAALAGLRDGTLPANKELLANLPASAGDLKNLTPAQREQLAQQLAQAAKGVKGINGVGGAMGAGAQVAQPNPDGVVAGTGDGPGGENAPLMLAADASDVGLGLSQGLTAADLKRLALGDKLGTTAGAHDVDPSKAIAPGAAGAVASPATGGEAVWVNRLTPTERAALKNFFK